MENLKGNRDLFVKWNDDFKCSYCKNDNFTLGNEVYTRFCDKCGKQENKNLINVFSKAKKTVLRIFSFFF
jgi:ribosomal protein L37AE/L43A